MPGHREHPLNAPLAVMVEELKTADAQMAQMAQGMGDFDSKELTPAEDELLFNHPSLRYLGQMHPATGLPYTNAQAAQQLLADLGPEQYVAYVDDVVRRMDRRTKEGQPDASGPEQPLPTATGLAEYAAASGPDVGPDAAVPAAPDWNA